MQGFIKTLTVVLRDLLAKPRGRPCYPELPGRASNSWWYSWGSQINIAVLDYSNLISYHQPPRLQTFTARIHTSCTSESRKPARAPCTKVPHPRISTPPPVLLVPIIPPKAHSGEQEHLEEEPRPGAGALLAGSFLGTLGEGEISVGDYSRMR